MSLRYIDKIVNGQDIYREGGTPYVADDYGISPMQIGGMGIYEYNTKYTYSRQRTPSALIVPKPSHALRNGEIYTVKAGQVTDKLPEVNPEYWTKLITDDYTPIVKTIADFDADSSVSFVNGTDRRIKIVIRNDGNKPYMVVDIKTANDDNITTGFNIPQNTIINPNLPDTISVYFNGVKIKHRDIENIEVAQNARSIETTKGTIITKSLPYETILTVKLDSVTTNNTFKNGDWLDLAYTAMYLGEEV